MNKNGFTLIEIIVALSIGLVIMLAVYSTSEMGQRSSVSIAQKVVTQQDARAVLDLMVMEIRMASYNPTSSINNNTWVDSNGAVISAADSKMFMKGIQKANANEIMIEMDLNSNGTVYDQANTRCYDNTVIYYKFDSNAQTISRQIGCGNSLGPLTVILGNATSQHSGTMVTNNATNPAVKLFTYWGPDIDNALADIDITNNVIANPTRWVPQIRRVVITIVADTELQDQMTRQKRRMTYSTSVIVRNHVLCPPFPNT